VLAGLAIFWAARLFIQLFIYSPTLWRGDRFRTITHIVLTCVWILFSATYASALWRQF
jgi:hypothetical protein